MYNSENILQLPRLSVILNFEKHIYDKTLYKRIFDYGIIEHYAIHSHWSTNKWDGIDCIAFKILLANPDEIYSFLKEIQKDCWKLECWLIRQKKPPKIIYSRITTSNDVIEEDFFWELDFELYEDPIFA